MFNRDDLLGGLVQAAFLGIAYWCGKSDAERKMQEDLKELCKQKEINDLKIQIAELKRINGMM